MPLSETMKEYYRKQGKTEAEIAAIEAALPVSPMYAIFLGVLNMSCLLAFMRFIFSFCFFFLLIFLLHNFLVDVLIRLF